MVAAVVGHTGGVDDHHCCSLGAAAVKLTTVSGTVSEVKFTMMSVVDFVIISMKPIILLALLLISV